MEIIYNGKKINSFKEIPIKNVLSKNTTQYVLKNNELEHEITSLKVPNFNTSITTQTYLDNTIYLYGLDKLMRDYNINYPIATYIEHDPYALCIELLMDNFLFIKKQFLINYITASIVNKLDFIIIPVFLHMTPIEPAFINGSKYESWSHANFICISINLKKIEYFEPYASSNTNLYNNEIIPNIILKELGKQIPLLNNYSLEYNESKINTLQKNDSYCAAWCLYIIYIKLINNNNASIEYIENMLLNKVDTNIYNYNIQLLQFINILYNSPCQNKELNYKSFSNTMYFEQDSLLSIKIDNMLDFNKISLNDLKKKYLNFHLYNNSKTTFINKLYIYIEDILKSKKIKYSKIKDKYNLKKQERNILAKKFNKYKDNLNECQLRLETIILERNQLNEQLSRLYNDYNILQKKYNLLRPLKPINIDKKVNLLDLSDEEEEIKQPVFLLTNTESYDTDMISSYIGDDISKLSIDS